MVQKNLVTTESLGYERQCNTYCTNHFSQWNLSTPNKKFTRSKQGAWSMIHKFKSSPVFPQPLHVSKQGAPEHVDYSQHDALQTVDCVFLKPLSGRPTLHFFTALVTHALNVFSRGTFANPESVKAARSHWFPKILISPPGHSSCSFMIFPRSIRLHIAWVNFLRFLGENRWQNIGQAVVPSSTIPLPNKFLDIGSTLALRSRHCYHPWDVSERVVIYVVWI